MSKGSTEKINRRRRRQDLKRLHRVLRSEFDPKAIKARVKRRRQEAIDRVALEAEIKKRAVGDLKTPPGVFGKILKVIKPKSNGRST